MNTVSPKPVTPAVPETLQANVLQASKIIGVLHRRGDRNPLHILTIRDPGGYQPIHYAAASGNVQLIKLLLEIFSCFPAQFLACVSAVDPAGNSPLHFAVEREYPEIVRLLVESGVNINQINSKGITSLHLATSLASDSPASIEIVEILLTNGADPTIPDTTGITCLHTACSLGNERVVDLLIQNGAQPNAVDDEQETPLFSAVRGQHKEVIRKLFQNGATVTPNSDDETVLDITKDVGDLEILELLKTLISV